MRATDDGLPVDLRIEPSELRYGAARLAEAIVTLTRRAAREAAVVRREQLAAQGVPRDLLDRMGLPTRAELGEDEPAGDAGCEGAGSWLERA